MVRKLTLILYLLAAPLVGEMPLHRFETEFSKKSIFPGETVRCDFVLYTRLPSVEVEVAKFPEFRGYWKKNTVLRQGKIHTPFLVYGTLWRRQLIGSYELIPMVGEQKPTIQPMKLVVRTPDPTGQSKQYEKVLLSKPAFPLKIKKLPRSNANYSGAVGEFGLRTLSPKISFQKDEPVVVKYVLEGRGNFQEINTLPIEFPSSVKILSKSAYVSGSFPYQSKIFEWVVSVQAQTSFSIPRVNLSYFNPDQQRYENALSGTIDFMVLEAQNPAPQAPRSDTPALETTWQAVQPWHRLPLFWVFHAVLLTGLATFLLRYKRSAPRPVEAKDLLKEQFLMAEQAFQKKDFDRFLKLAEGLAIEKIKQRLGLPPTGSPKRLILKQADGQLAPEALAAANFLVQAHENRCYAPEALKPENPDALWSALQTVLAA